LWQLAEKFERIKHENFHKNYYSVEGSISLSPSNTIIFVLGRNDYCWGKNLVD